MSDARIELPPARRVQTWLLSISISLAVAGWIARRIDAATSGASLHHLMLRFDLGQEDGLAMWLKTALFLLLAGLAWARSREGRSHVGHWRALSGLCLALSIEKVVAFSQIAVPLLNRYAGAAGWVALGALGLAVAALFLPWLRGLPAGPRRRVALGVALLLVGGIGLELLGTRLTGAVSPLLSDLVVSLEEGLELCGLSLVLCALLALGEEPGAGP